MTTIIQRSYQPTTSDSTPISWSEEQISEHAVKLSISVNYHLAAVAKSDDLNRKYYFTFSLGGYIEGKSEILAAGDQKWILQQDVVINKDLILEFYRNPSEIILWEIAVIPKDLRKKKKEADDVSVLKKKTIMIEPKTSNAIQMSVANTGLQKKHLRLKTQGKFIPSQIINPTSGEDDRLQNVDDRGQLIDPLLLRKRSLSTPSLGSDIDDWRERPGSGSSILSRPTSASFGNIETFSRSVVHSRTHPQPHHFNHPEKHVDVSLMRTGLVRSRSSSLTNIMKSNRPRTPPSPHHHDHPLKTIKKENTKFKNLKSKNPANLGTDKTSSANTKKVNIRWGGSASPLSSAYRDLESRNHSARLENDHQILSGTCRQLREKRNGDSLHSPVERIIIDINPILLGELEINGTIKSCRKQLSDCFFKISIDAPLLSEQQKQILNPIVITLGNADGMPNSPIPYDILDSVSQPIYVKFKFFNDPFYHSAILNQKHGTTLNFQSKHVILPGLLDSKKLLDEIKQSKFIIEIHDRDYKYSKEEAEKHSRFFEGGVMQSNLNPISPFGQAYFDLTDLYSGILHHQFETTILPSPRIDKNLARGSLLQGDYFGKSAVFSISIDFENPLLQKKNSSMVPRYSSLSIFCNNDGDFIKKILLFLMNYNFRALKLEANENEDQERLLASHAISESDSYMDILHGYHIYDAENHLLFIEGQDKFGIALLGEYLLQNVDNCVFAQNEATYYRQKPITSAALMHLYIEPAIKSMCLWSKRTLIMSPTFASFHYFNKIITSQRNEWRPNSFPFPSRKLIFPLLKGSASIKTTTELYHSLKKEITKVQSKSKIQPEFSPKKTTSANVSEKKTIASYKVVTHKIDSNNLKHIQQLKMRENREPNFIAINSKRDFSYSPSFSASTEISVFNYSIQKYSSTQKQIRDLQSKLKQDKTKIFAFGGDFLSSVPE